jgi:hypothetical protein
VPVADHAPHHAHHHGDDGLRALPRFVDPVKGGR